MDIKMHNIKNELLSLGNFVAAVFFTFLFSTFVFKADKNDSLHRRKYSKLL